MEAAGLEGNNGSYNVDVASGIITFLSDNGITAGDQLLGSFQLVLTEPFQVVTGTAVLASVHPSPVK